MGLEAVKEWLHYCGRCNSCKFLYRNYRESCPAFEKFNWESYTASGKVWLAWDLYRGIYDWNESVIEKIFACTLCGNCAEQCQQEISNHHLDIFEALREEAVERGLGPMSAHRGFKENVDKVNNPYGEPHESRFPEMMQKFFKQGADVAYFVGCTSAYREKNLANSSLFLLSKMGVNFTLIPEEWCCGSPLLTTGQRLAAEFLARHNIEAIKQLGVKTVVVSCAGCYRTLKKQYPEKYGLDFADDGIEVLHFAEFLAREKKRLKPFLKNSSKKQKLKVTYHDPCHLGRHAGVYEAPRDVIKMIPGIELVEMERIKENAWCCGAGAGVKSQFKEWAVEISAGRVKEAEEIDTVEVLASACPFCERNLKDAVTAEESPMRVLDVNELLIERCFPNESVEEYIKTEMGACEPSLPASEAAADKSS